MRCPDCSKFVSQDLADPEVNSLEINGDGTVTAEVRVFLACADCGTELKEATLYLEEDFSDKLTDHCGVTGHELDVDEEDVEGLDEYQTTDRRGKPIKNVRYQKHLYGARVGFKITCSCQEKGADPILSESLEETVEASGMDELV